MARARPWLVIPVMGLAGAAIAFALGHPPIDCIALALLAATLAAAIRAFGAPSLATAITAGAGATLGVLGVVGSDDVRGIAAAAAAMFAICELARVKPPGASPWPAVGAALVAGVLAPVYVVLVAVAGAQVAPRPRWVLAVPALGVIATALAVVAATTHACDALWLVWAGHAHAPSTDVFARAGDVLGPLAATAALAGLVLAATHGRFAAAAVVGVAALCVLDMFASGAIGPALPVIAALGAGVAIGRLAAMLRAPVGQTCVAAAAGFVLVVVPAWALL